MVGGVGQTPKVGRRGGKQEENKALRGDVVVEALSMFSEVHSSFLQVL